MIYLSFSLGVVMGVIFTLLSIAIIVECESMERDGKKYTN